MHDFAGIWELFKTHNCSFQSLRENFDTTTAAGEMVLYTIANIAQFERRQVSERVAVNMNARAQQLDMILMKIKLDIYFLILFIVRL